MTAVPVMIRYSSFDFQEEKKLIVDRLIALLKQILPELFPAQRDEEDEPDPELTDFTRFTEAAQQVAIRAVEMLPQYGHKIVDVEHIFLALVQDASIQQLFQTLNVDVTEISQPIKSRLQHDTWRGDSRVPPGKVYITPRVKKLIDSAFGVSTRLLDSHIGVEHFLLAMTREKAAGVPDLLKLYGITYESILSIILKPDD
jgi:ATP-dependent Clp protease ATP-binding subunit ClpC